MDLHRLAAGLVVVGFEGTEVPPEARSLVAQGVFGAILFQRNIEGAAQVARLNDALKREAGRPFVTCVDQEGGRVARLRGEPFTALPPMRALGAQGDESLAFGAGALLAREVRAVWDSPREETEAARSAAFRARVGEAARRVEAMARRFASAPQGEAGLARLRQPDHRSLAARLLQASAKGRDPTEPAKAT